MIESSAAVHFPNYDLDLLFRPKLLSSVRPRDFARECFFRFFTLRKILRASERSLADLPHVCLDRVCPRTVRASSRKLFLLRARTHLPLFLLSKLGGMVSVKTDGIDGSLHDVLASTELMESSARRHDVITIAELTELSAQSLTYRRL